MEERILGKDEVPGSIPGPSSTQGYRSGQTELTVNQLPSGFVGSNPTTCTTPM